MAIKIIDEPDLELTREEHDRLRQQYTAYMQFTVRPVSFETFARQQVTRERNTDTLFVNGVRQ